VRRADCRTPDADACLVSPASRASARRRLSLARAAAAGAAAQAAPLTYVPLSSSAAPDAVCNDGTAAGYYFAPGANASSLWLVFLESGGWCYDAASCAKRSPDQTSSKNRAPGSVASLAGIFASADPRLATANKAYVPYCTSDAYVGDRAGPVWPPAGPADAGNSVFQGGFHGAAVVAGVLAALRARGLGSAAGDTEVLFAGFSAGGRGAMFNCDAVGARLAREVPRLRFACFFDSALWLDVEPYAPGAVSAAARSQAAYALFNASGVVADNSPGCAAAYPGDDGWHCIFGEFALPHVATPRWFAQTNLYDSYQLNTINGLPNGPPWSGAKLAYAEAFRTRMEATIAREVPAGDGDRGAFAAACYAHGDTLNSKFSSLLVGGVSLESALLSWYSGDASVPRITVDATPGGNGNPTCKPAEGV